MNCQFTQYQYHACRVSNPRVEPSVYTYPLLYEGLSLQSLISMAMNISTTSFSLAGKGLKLDEASDLVEHLGPLSVNPEIEHVDLSGNTLGIGACEALSAVLKTKKELRSANLADIFTSRLLSEIPTALSHLLDALVTLPHLHTVNLNDNAFGLSLIAPLSKFISNHVPLQHLHLNNNGMGPIAGAQLADALIALHAAKAKARKADSKADVPELETIVCGRNRLETGSMQSWANVFQTHKSLQVVRMVQNGIRMEGIALLLREGLPGCRALRILDLEDNTFTERGSLALASSLPSWTALEELGVGDCLLSARGGALLMNALMKGANTSLRVLRLQHNELTTANVRMLNMCLKDGSLPGLAKVELNGNKADPEGEEIVKLMEMLHERRERAGVRHGHEDWGLDELDDMEDEDSEVESSDGEEDSDAVDSEDDVQALKRADPADEHTLRHKVILREEHGAPQQPVAMRKDPDVDRLADDMQKKATIG